MKIKPTIELIHPPHPTCLEDRLDAPLGLLYIASNLRENGYNVRVTDLSGRAERDWDIGMADIYGTTIYAPTLKISQKISSICKDINPGAKIVAGGAHPTALPYHPDFINFDIVVAGEGENAMLEIARAFPQNERIYKNALDKNLDTLPNPAYDLVDVRSYKRVLNGSPALTTLTSRGCPYRCSFCGLPEHHKIVKKRSPERVAEEIAELKKQYGIDKFIFQDDIFTLDKRRLYRLLDLLKPLEIGFKAHGRSGNDTYEDYKRMRDSGCETIAWGIESGSQKMLDLMNKRTTVEKNEDVINWAKELGITTRAFFVLGFPGETAETIEETKRFIEKVDVDQCFVSNFVPYPGTDVWNNPEKYGVENIHVDFEQYYQVNESGSGSRNIETKELSIEKFKKLEEEFRIWLRKRGQRGAIQEYEKKLE
jgi:anaerobic magnesium-protoporphyrin IX monomethyl ester cyclase